jgi:hypothetical protein
MDTTMCALIRLQVTHVSKCVALSDIWTCCTKDTCVSWWASSYTCDLILYYTHHRFTDAGLYVQAGVVLFYFWLKVLLHIPQAYRHWQVCDIWCLFISDLRLNIFLHMSQANRRWPVCVTWWLRKWYLWTNVFCTHHRHKDVGQYV